MKKTRLFAIVVTILTFFLLSGCSRLWGGSPDGNLSDDDNEVLSSTVSDNQNRNNDKRVFLSEEIYELGEKSVVEIVTYNKEGKRLSLGTGFIIKSNGQIVTNYHVIKQAFSINVSIGELNYDVTEIIAYDKGIDLAILKIEAFRNLPALTLNKTLQRGGATIYAIGSSEGLTLSFSSGTISSPSRVFDGIQYIQHNASISHGNSGGPLFNVYGEVIGINTLTITTGQNLNFAIAISEIDNLSKNNPVSMDEFYTTEVIDSIPKLPTDGTKISDALTGQTDFNDYLIPLKAGETLKVYMVPKYKIDLQGIICGLIDSDYNVFALGSVDTITNSNFLSYQNTSSQTQNLFYCVLYDKNYIFKDLSADYELTAYVTVAN